MKFLPEPLDIRLVKQYNWAMETHHMNFSEALRSLLDLPRNCKMRRANNHGCRFRLVLRLSAATSPTVEFLTSNPTAEDSLPKISNLRGSSPNHKG